MSTAAATGSDLHSSSALCFQRPQQLYCQHCGHTALVRSSNTAGRLEMNDSVTPSHLEPSIVLSADDGLQPSASIGSHDHLESGRIQGADGGHTAHQLASAQAANTIPFRQKPLAELASEMLARQPDSAASQGTAQQAANCERCKILRFDPSLGTDGAFYFTASQSLDMQPPASQCELDQMAATSSSSCPQPADAMVQQQQQHQHSGSRPGSPSRHMRLPEPASLQAATQSGRHEDGVHPYVAPGEKARQSSSDQAAHAQSRAGITEVGDAQVQPMQADDAKTVGEQQVAVQAQPQFPIQGGGEAGVLLRAAAAAAAGCSHELVVAAAGRACVEEELNSR